MKIILVLIFSCSFALKASEQLNFYMPTNLESQYIIHQESLDFFADNTLVLEPKLKKLKAVLLAIFLGHFGVHRIYLGTSPNVPVVYSLTLGGGFGLLPLFDIIAILTSKDLDQFSNNSRVFMWSKAKE